MEAVTNERARPRRTAASIELRRREQRRAVFAGLGAVLTSVALAGCPLSREGDVGGEDASLPDVVELDVGIDAPPDAPPTDVRVRPDASWMCSIDDDCLAEHSCEYYWACRPFDDRADMHGCLILFPGGWCPFGFVCREGTYECVACRDEDGDHFAAADCGGTDCDDTDPNIQPRSGAADGCGGGDEDCDGRVDENPELWFYRDEDEDGFAADGPYVEATRACSAASGWAPLRGDCVDDNPEVHPGAPELCDGWDNDCNYLLDGPGEDDDGDGWPDEPCLPGPWSDCDDEDARTFFGAFEETCEAVDRNCDGHVSRDYDADGSLAYQCGGDDCDDYDASLVGPVDADGDGHASERCVFLGDDCNDSDPLAYPGAPEICNRRRDDCEVFGARYYEDFDGDGFAATDAECRDDLPGAFPRTDCDDGSAARHPGAAERCDGVDNDCDPSSVDGSAPGSCPSGTACTDGACR